MICECWTADIWKFIHVIARTSSIIENEEKAAFCTLLLSINQIISCDAVRREIIFFMENESTNIVHHLSSNEQLLSWTWHLRKHIYTIYNKSTPSYEQILEEFNPDRLKKDVWGPMIWKGIHIIPLRAKTQHGFCSIDVSIALKAFFTCVALLIPCPYCRKHAWEYYSMNSIDEWLDTPIHAFEWTVYFHNNANEVAQLKRPTMTPQDALLLYDNTIQNPKWKKYT